MCGTWGIREVLRSPDNPLQFSINRLSAGSHCCSTEARPQPKPLEVSKPAASAPDLWARKFNENDVARVQLELPLVDEPGWACLWPVAR